MVNATNAVILRLFSSSDLISDLQVIYKCSEGDRVSM